MNYRLNEFYMEVLKDWVGKADIPEKAQVLELVKEKLKQRTGYERRERWSEADLGDLPGKVETLSEAQPI